MLASERVSLTLPSLAIRKPSISACLKQAKSPLTHWLLNCSGFFYGFENAYNLLYCNVSVRDIHYRYTTSIATDSSSGDLSSLSSGTFETRTSGDASLRTTMLLASMLDSNSMSTNMWLATEDIGPQAGPFTDIYALQLSKQLIGLSAALYEPFPAVAVSSLKPAIGSRIQVVPLILTLSVACLYW